MTDSPKMARQSQAATGTNITVEDGRAHRGPDAAGPALRPSHQRILDAFLTHGTMTPDELAEKMARSVFYTRPRCSELRAMGLLRPTGEVRRNRLSGLMAEVLTP
jgi:hypothetical protein